MERALRCLVCLPVPVTILGISSCLPGIEPVQAGTTSRCVPWSGELEGTWVPCLAHGASCRSPVRRTSSWTPHPRSWTVEHSCPSGSSWKRLPAVSDGAQQLWRCLQPLAAELPRRGGGPRPAPPPRQDRTYVSAVWAAERVLRGPGSHLPVSSPSHRCGAGSCIGSAVLRGRTKPLHR
jgi:hypothetical protein